ncbi:MAG TPA: S1/P1 nuclease [Gammaproteobacteria bacterium]|nr:S1/P1 nuclease [Gammaproteobacteria bacterium]
MTAATRAPASTPVPRTVAIVIVSLACLSAQSAFGWGRDGHTLAGLAAQPLLCDAAAGEVARLGGGEGLARLGRWADEVRRRPDWEHSAPWHYVNIPDSGNPRNPPFNAEGNVITAIEQHLVVLKSAAAPQDDRATALRFLVHFIADIHQPMHVGRAEDRGGNRIDVSYGATATNLHAFWDTDVIRLSGRGVEEYAAIIAEQARATALRDRDSQVRDWAEQVFALRARVYEFNTATGFLDAGYLDMAANLAERQLVLAAARLANTLNDALCG